MALLQLVVTIRICRESLVMASVQPGLRLRVDTAVPAAVVVTPLFLVPFKTLVIWRPLSLEKDGHCNTGLKLPPCITNGFSEPGSHGLATPEPYGENYHHSGVGELVLNVFMVAGWPPRVERANTTAKGGIPSSAVGCCCCC